MPSLTKRQPTVPVEGEAARRAVGMVSPLDVLVVLLILGILAALILPAAFG